MTYPSKKAALKAAEKMGNKHGVHFSVYKCLYCDGMVIEYVLVPLIRSIAK